MRRKIDGARSGPSMASAVAMDPPGSDRVVQQLYEIAAWFSPPPASVARMEASVMAQFEAAFGASSAPTPAAEAVAVVPAAAVSVGQRLELLVRIRSAFATPLWRRALTVSLAAVLAIGSVAAVFAESSPGQPFYRLRLQVETIGLPAPGTAARLQADLDRVGRRLAELTAAGQAGDAAAAEDSAAAYSDELQDVLAGDTGQDAATVAALLEHHQQVLAQLAATAPAPARAALARAAAAAHRAENTVHPAKAGPAIVTGPPAEAGPTEASAERDLGDEAVAPSEERADGNGLGQEGAPGSDASRHHAAPPVTVHPTGDPDRPGKPTTPPGKDGSHKTTNASDSTSNGAAPSTPKDANGPKQKDAPDPKPTSTARTSLRQNVLAKSGHASHASHGAAKLARPHVTVG